MVTTWRRLRSVIAGNMGVHMTDDYEYCIHHLLYKMIDSDFHCIIASDMAMRTLSTTASYNYTGCSDNYPEALAPGTAAQGEQYVGSPPACVSKGQCSYGNDAENDDVNCVNCHAGLRAEPVCNRVIVENEKLLSDEDLLALILSKLVSRTNPRIIAMNLINRFDTIGAVISARSDQLLKINGVTNDVVSSLKAVGAAGVRLAREDITNRSVIDAWDKLITYLMAAMSNLTVEQFRVMFLDRRNVLLSDEVQHQGTIDHTPVYPREIVKRALELDSSAIIMVHNHPSNHPIPSKVDIEMTKKVQKVLDGIGMVLHDHIIVSRRGHTSFRQGGWL